MDTRGGVDNNNNSPYILFTHDNNNKWNESFGISLRRRPGTQRPDVRLCVWRAKMDGVGKKKFLDHKNFLDD